MKIGHLAVTDSHPDAPATSVADHLGTDMLSSCVLSYRGHEAYEAQTEAATLVLGEEHTIPPSSDSTLRPRA
jgi:hypothetical protein